MAIGIDLRIQPDTQEQAAKVTDVLSKVATGLAFDGLDVTLTILNYDDSDEDET